VARQSGCSIWRRVPRGENLGQISQTLLAELEETFARRRNAERAPLYGALERRAGAAASVELLAELGEPWGKLWQLLADTHGERDAARVLAKLLGAVQEHGEERMRPVLEAALAKRRIGLFDLIATTCERPAAIVTGLTELQRPLTHRCSGCMEACRLRLGSPGDYCC
jgi:hypothetical protein